MADQAIDLTEQINEDVKYFGIEGYHEIFENKKPQINADKRGFVIAYLQFYDFNTNGLYSPK